MTTRKRKRRDWELFPKKDGAKRTKYKFNILKEKKVDPSYYYVLDKSRSRRCIKPRNVRFVQQNSKLQPHVALFKNIAINAKRFCKTYDKNELNIFKALDDIIPIDFFGITRNRKIFYRIVNIFLTSTTNEVIPAKNIISGYAIEEIPWLKVIKAPILRRRYLYKAILWLLEKIVQPIGSHLYYVLKNTGDTVYYSRSTWSSFKQKALHELIQTKRIVRTDRDRESSLERGAVIGTLKILPKGTITRLTSFRPLIQIKRKFNYRELSKHINHLMKTICQTNTGDMYYCWRNYLWKVGNKKIYAIKVDVSNGYSNTNLEFLEERIKETNGIPMHFKRILINYMNHQYIEIPIKSKQAKIYKWTEGLIQGGQLSGILFNLFMSYVDNFYLNGFYKTNCLLHRYVDDYLFCSTDPSDVKRFLDKISTAHRLNMDKLMSNIEPYNHEKIIYCGKVFDMITYEIKAHYEFSSTGYLHHKLNVWRHKQLLSKEAILAKAMLYRYNCSHFNKIELNTYFNTEATVMYNFFQAMILLAYKFHSVVYTMHSLNDMELYGHVITQTVRDISSRVLEKVIKLKGKYFKNNISFGLLLKVSYTAFKIVLERRYNMYKPLILEIKKCLKNIWLPNWMSFGNNLKIRTMPAAFKNLRASRKLIILSS